MSDQTPTPNPDSVRRCFSCGRSEDHTRNWRGKFTVELRPYGPGGVDVCFECATASPDAEVQAARSFAALLDATEAISDGPVMIGVDTNGPIPFNPGQIDGSERGA